MATAIIQLPKTAPEFPRALIEIPGGPEVLFIKGILPATDRPALAIVGTRKATTVGKNLADRFARALTLRGFSIVSGLAFGIDAAAHEGCLEAGGHTTAVLPCGLDRVYPRSHVSLAEKILKHGGALVSEYPPDTEALPYRFLERNRIVSGLAQGVLIIEAPERSGALATARFAAEQGRDCFVLPGPATHPNYEGAHELIRKGAQLVYKPEHVLEAYGMLESATASRLEPADLSEEEKIIYEILKGTQDVMDVDKIINQSTLQPQAVNRTLTFLLIKGVVKEEPGGYMINLSE